MLRKKKQDVSFHFISKVVKMEVDDDPEDSEAQPSSVTAAMSVKTETTSSTTEVPPESNNANMTRIKESSDDANTCLTVSRSKDNAEIFSNTAGALKMETTSKIMGSSQTVTHPNISMMHSSKFSAKSSNSVPETTKSTAPSSKHTTPASCCTLDTTKSRETDQECTAPISICTATTSSTSKNPKFGALSKPVESRSVAVAKASTASNAEAACRTASASKMGNASKSSNTAVACQSVVTSLATSKLLVKCDNTDASVKTAHVKNSGGSVADIAPNTHKNKAPAAPHPTARSKNKNPHTEPSHKSASKTKPSETPKVPKVGKYYLYLFRGKSLHKCLWIGLFLILISGSALLFPL